MQTKTNFDPNGIVDMTRVRPETVEEVVKYLKHRIEVKSNLLISTGIGSCDDANPEQFSDFFGRGCFALREINAIVTDMEELLEESRQKTKLVG